MNKAAFLNIVRQVAPIQDQEVDDLERLVVSFPYCQTAHVLLAKAAYDRGSMLSTQKLRRAAAHVSNRQLLKQLVYAAPAVEEMPALVEEGQEVEPTGLEPFSENEPQIEFYEVVPEEEQFSTHLDESHASTAEEFHSSTEEPDESFETDEIDLEEAVLDEQASSSVEVPSLEEEENLVFSEVTTEEPPVDSQIPFEEEIKSLEDTLVREEASEETLMGSPEVPVSFVEEETEESQEELEEPQPEVILSEEEDNLDELLELIQISSLSSLSAPIPSVSLSHEEIMAELTSVSEIEDLEEPAIDFEKVAERLSAQVEDQETPPQMEEEGLSAYLEIAKLDSLYDTSGYEFPTLKLPEVVQGTTSSDEAAQDPYLSIFTQNNLAYWMGSSRLGESIQLKDDLTTTTPFFFQPELIIEHVKEKNAPVVTPEVSSAAKLDMQLDIINQFLKTTPKRKTLANAQLNNEPQEDLSAKSSKVKKTLVSENLALIFIKQGKGKKAIKIYEQLIVKFPEKKSYFAEQIDKLRNE